MHRLASVAWAFASVALAFVFGLAGCAHYEVTRVYGGRVRAERFIDEVAYHEFLVGAELEERGEWSAAAAAYRRALSDDPESVEAWPPSPPGIISVPSGRGTYSAAAPGSRHLGRYGGPFVVGVCCRVLWLGVVVMVRTEPAAGTSCVRVLPAGVSSLGLGRCGFFVVRIVIIPQGSPCGVTSLPRLT